MTTPRPAIERFMEKVEKTDSCWLWKAHISKRWGYGTFSAGARRDGPIRAHRWAYAHFKGPIPEGLMVLHSCHNRACVNPDHLSLGTHRDNMNDMKAAGRSLAGGKVANARLDAVSVQVIRCVMATKVFTQDELAKWWGVSRATISHAVTGRNWGSV